MNQQLKRMKCVENDYTGFKIAIGIYMSGLKPITNSSSSPDLKVGVRESADDFGL